MCQRSLVDKKIVSTEADKENIGPNRKHESSSVGDVFKKKTPSNPININFQKDLGIIKREIPVCIASSRILCQTSYENKPHERPSTAAGPKLKKDSEFISSLMKNNKKLGADLTEMFKKKKTHNLTSALSGAKSPPLNYPSTLILEKCLNSAKPKSDKKSEIENILLRLLEEHKTTASSESKIFNKLAFIEKAIKR